MKEQIPETPILVNSSLTVKAEASLSAKVLEELENKEEKDLKEIIDAQNKRND